MLELLGKTGTLASARSSQMQNPSSEAPKGQHTGHPMLSLWVLLELGLAFVQGLLLPVSVRFQYM